MVRWIMALHLYRRHTAACTHKRPLHDKTFNKCACTCHVSGTLQGEVVRTSLRTRDWREASRIVLDAESRGYWKQPKAAGGSKTIEEAVALFMADAKSEKGRSLRHSTIEKYSTLLEKRLCEFAK